MTKTILYTLAIILLIAIGFFVYGNFLDIFSFVLDMNNVQLSTTSATGMFYQELIMGCTLGSIPLLQLLTNKIAAYKNKPVKSGFVTIANILVFGGIFLVFKIIKLHTAIGKAAEAVTNDQVTLSFSVDNLQFSLHLFIGFVVGAIVSIGVIKRKNREDSYTE